MKRYIHIIILSIGLTLLNSCIENDIPYPRIQANFAAFEVEGQSQPAVIDTVTRNVIVYLPETVDPSNVTVTYDSLSPKGVEVIGGLPKTLDLTQTVNVTLKLYQEYAWTIQAVQPIQRYFTIEGQIGTSVIDVAAQRVIAKIPDTADISSLKVTSMKLGPEGSMLLPDLTGTTVDFTNPVEVIMTSFGKQTKWTIYVEPTQSNVTTKSADAWTSVIWVYGEARIGLDNGVEYRKADIDQWTKVPVEWITSNEGDFTARIIHLDPNTDYVVRTYSDNEYGNEITVTTGSVRQVQNAGLDQWWLNDKVWCPWEENGDRYWDTGNRGATTLGSSNSVPTDDTPSGTGRAAMLQSKFVGIGPAGKLAAGNLFTGEYVKTVGTNGILNFGREFSERPTRLRLYLKYNPVAISHASKTESSFDHMKGQPDTCIVWMALSDSETPYEIRTEPKNRQLFNPNDPSVIAYGQFQSGAPISQYTQIEIDFDYRSTSRIPRYLTIVCSASKYGDYFTGGDGSVLCVDELELLYDY